MPLLAPVIAITFVSFISFSFDVEIKQGHQKMVYARPTMNLSRSSKSPRDPLSDVLALLDARATRPTRLEAAGDWALAFPERERLKFVAVLKGACWIELPGHAGEFLHTGDVCLIGRTSYTVASRPGVPSIDGMQYYEGMALDRLRLNGDDTIMLGGGITLARENAGFLLDMLPVFAVVPRSPGAAASVAAVLKLLDAEITRDAIGSETATARLAEVLMIEAIRARTVGPVPAGWLDALAEPRLGRALALIHNNIAEPWTVARLAAEVGMSRSAFASLFTRTVAQPPLDYVRSWRLARARAMLANGEDNIAQVAITVGYSSQSAFAHAYRRAFGTTPRGAFKPSVTEENPR
ncbi:AraC family transcriptional regulator [Burkholderia sp. 3C]